jgi:hypothetical protein
MSLNKESLQVVRNKVVKFFTQDFKELFTSHINDNHTFLWTEGTFKLHKTTGIDLNIIVFVLMGNNEQKPEYGSIEKYNLTPASSTIEEKYREIASEILEEDKTIQCSFTNKSLYYKNPLNYKVHVEIKDKDSVDTKEKKAENPKSYANIAKKLKVSEPKVSEPKVSEPKVSEPKVSEPKVSVDFENDVDIMIQQKKLKISQIELEIQEIEITKLKKRLEASKLEKELQELSNKEKLPVKEDPSKERPMSPELTEILQQFDNSKQNWFDTIEPPAPKSKPSTPRLPTD